MRFNLYVMVVISALVLFRCASSAKNTQTETTEPSQAQSGKTRSAPVQPVAAPESSLKVAQAVVATGVENRAPVGEAQTFSGDVGKVYCFTHIEGGNGGGEVKHVWFYNDREIATVILAVKSASWKTWSSKTMDPSWKGNWRVDVQDATGTVIGTVAFKLE